MKAKTKSATSIKNEQYLAAVPDVDSAIEKHGFDAIRWVVNKRGLERKLQRELADVERKAQAEIARIKSRLQSK